MNLYKFGSAKSTLWPHVGTYQSTCQNMSRTWVSVQIPLVDLVSEENVNVLIQNMITIITRIDWSIRWTSYESPVDPLIVICEIRCAKFGHMFNLLAPFMCANLLFTQGLSDKSSGPVLSFGRMIANLMKHSAHFILQLFTKFLTSCRQFWVFLCIQIKILWSTAVWNHHSIAYSAAHQKHVQWQKLNDFDETCRFILFKIKVFSLNL